MKNKIWMFALFAAVFVLGGCAMKSSERVKLKDLDFTVLSEEMIPEELKTVIEERKEKPFQLTYSDRDNMYIVVGYGTQKGGGYSIAVNKLYLTDSAAYVDTTLLGPDEPEEGGKNPSWPYIVIKTELLKETVIFE